MTPAPARRLAAWLMLALATVALITGTCAVWARRQVLDPDRWAGTSSRLLADPTISRALGTFAADELFRAADVTPLVGDGQVTAQLRHAAIRLVTEQLRTGPVRNAWREANRAAASQLVALLDGGGTVLRARNGEVTLDLGPVVSDLDRTLVGQLAGALLPSAERQRLVDAASQDAGRFVILRSDQLPRIQHAARAIRGLAIALPALALALALLALAIAPGWRRSVIVRIGWCALAAGVILLLGRWLLREPIVDQLVSDRAFRPAGEAAWSIATDELRTLAIAIGAAGAVTGAVAWLAGLGRRLTAVRRRRGRRGRGPAATARRR